MSDDSTAPADLSSLGIDLSDMFRPAWTTETSDGSARLAAQFDEGDRPERFGGGRRDRDGGRPGRGPRPDRGPRPERANRSPGPDRTKDTEGRRGPTGQGGRSRHEGGGNRQDRGERRGRREDRDRRPEPQPKPLLEGWKLQLVPEPVAIEGIARQIRSRAKAYPLFELARLIVQLSDRYSVRLQAESEETPELFRAKVDGSVWQTRKEAVSHLLSKHLGKFYRKSSITTESPKGAFSVVAQCGMSGVLLGPPNHHEYTTRLIALHAERFRNMPFEVYKSRVKMMRDETLLDQWKIEQSTKTVYIPVTEEAVADSAELETPSPLGDDAVGISPDGTAQASAETAAEIPAEAAAVSAEETVPESSGETTEVPAETTGEPAADEATPAEESKVPENKSEEGLSWDQITAHFNEHHAEGEIEASGRDITLRGGVALHGSTQLLRELLLKNLQELDRFPLPLAQVLGRELTNRGLQLFKSHKKIINVSVARPRYLDRENTPIGTSFKAILEYLEAHPKQHRDKQWAALLALRTETAESEDGTAQVTERQEVIAATVEPSSEAMVSEAPAATQTSEVQTPETSTKPSPTKPLLDEATLRRREKALGADLLWLLHQGHVIDFAMGNLQAATRPAPKPTATPTAMEKAADSQNIDETLTGDTDAAQQGGSAAMFAEQPQDEIHEPVVHHEPLEIPEGVTLVIPPPPDDMGAPGQVLPS